MIRLRLAAAFLLAGAAMPALADPKPSIDQRVDRVEKELRAVQRKVFPGGSPAFFEPEIAAPTQQAVPVGAPANAPLNELSARVDALEKTVAQLTGQIEQDEHRLSLMSEQSARDRAEFDARLKAIEAAAAPAPAQPAPLVPDNAALQPMPARPGRGAASLAPPAGKPVPVTPTKSASGKPAPIVAAPQDDTPPPSATAPGADAGEDAYMAGYRLWRDKKYGEAETALKAFVAKYPRHRRASYAQNLLGRSYLDDGSPANAAQAFAANYQTNPRGDRAQESLYYLGQALVQLKKPSDACRVYDEISSAYGDKVDPTLKPKIAAARRDAECK